MDGKADPKKNKFKASKPEVQRISGGKILELCYIRVTLNLVVEAGHLKSVEFD